ncbi:hypothetical protein [Hymenobacter guriensis]|uniref:Uncharacterized protein n=1 Tax=Hymenobacter guriensis TaxID=2793065 RepID=A0ABS0L1M0_9BACT|nr:hypothetical protein [Hymenobacter guriensis]MBG8554018.1 hypothetical protein [Hymenobacter guriensis]
MRIKLPFWGRRQHDTGEALTENTGVAAAPAELVAALPAVAAPISESIKGDKVLNGPDEQRWIENDGLLRDEGVLFGMSGGDMAAKLAVIEHYYARQIREAEQECRLAGERLETAQQVLSQQQNLMKERRQEWQELHTRLTLAAHDFLRATVGMVLYGGVITLVYFLLYDWLKPYWPRHTGLIVAGVYGFGMLSLFQRGSFLYAGNRPVAGTEPSEATTGTEAARPPEKWKVMLEEVGVPAVTALLAVVWGWPDHTPAQGVAMYLFLFFAFLFTGKGFLNNIVRVTTSLRAVGNNFRQRKWRKRRLAELTKLQVEDERVLKERTDVARLLEEKRDLLPDAEQLRLQCLTKQELFRSEYVLANEARGVLTLEEVLSVRPEQAN